jgi:hypothetical protein
MSEMIHSDSTWRLSDGYSEDTMHEIVSLIRINDHYKDIPELMISNNTDGLAVSIAMAVNYEADVTDPAWPEQCPEHHRDMIRKIASEVVAELSK